MFENSSKPVNQIGNIDPKFSIRKNAFVDSQKKALQKKNEILKQINETNGYRINKGHQ